MKKYIFGAILAFAILASPASSYAAGLTSTQINAILTLLSAFNADATTIANVSAALNGTYTPNNTAVTATANSSGPIASVSTSPTGPWSINGSVPNTGGTTIYVQTTGLIKANGPKGCSSPVASTGCLNLAAYRDFTTIGASPEWINDTTVRTIVLGGQFPNGIYAVYIAYPNGQPIKVGTFGLGVSVTSTTNTTGGTVNAAAGYAWEVYAGQGAMVSTATYGASDPSLRCDSSSYGTQVDLGPSSKATDVVATCVKPGDTLDANGRVVSVGGTFTMVRKISSSASTSSSSTTASPCFVTGAGQTCSAGSTTGTNTTTSSAGASSGAVFGPSGSGSQPTTYAWYSYAGSMLLLQTPENLGYPTPTVACTANNVGATYEVGIGQKDVPVVAKCLASNQGLTDFVPLTSSTLNQPKASTSSGSTSTTSTTSTTNTTTTSTSATATTAAPACTPTNGTFVNDSNQTVAWIFTCGAPAPDSSWSPQPNSFYHKVVGYAGTFDPVTQNP